MAHGTTDGGCHQQPNQHAWNSGNTRLTDRLVLQISLTEIANWAKFHENREIVEDLAISHIFIRTGMYPFEQLYQTCLNINYIRPGVL